MDHPRWVILGEEVKAFRTTLESNNYSVMVKGRIKRRIRVVSEREGVGNGIGKYILNGF